MKFALLSILILLTDTYLFAQNEQIDFEPIEIRIRQLQPLGTIYYADNADEKIYSKLSVLLNKSVFKDVFDTSNISILRLTIEERKYIQSQLAQSAKMKFSNNLFKNSKRIQKGSLVPFVDNMNRRILDSINHLSDTLRTTAYRRFQSFRHWSFIFTKPIFIRSKTIAVYYFMYYTMSSGADGAAFYKRMKYEWHKWVMIPGMGGAW